MRATVAFVGVLLASICTGAPFTNGNILVTSGFIGVQPQIFEYTRTGSLVQTINVPIVSGQSSSDYNRDVLVDSRGWLHVFNGTFNPYISTFDPITNTWQHRTMAGFGIANNGTYGKLAASGDFVFATDGNVDRGIVRLNVITGKIARYALQANNESPIDLHMGRDGLLYSLNGEGSPSGRFIRAYDPMSMDLVRSIDLPTTFTHGGQGGASRCIYVDDKGYIYLNQLHSPIYKLSPDGQTVITSANYTHGNFVIDMDVSDEGHFMFTNSGGHVTMLDSNLVEFRTFVTASNSNSNSFGAYIETVPEPGTIAALGMGALVVLRRRLKA